jgi:hypothetical protein
MAKWPQMSPSYLIPLGFAINSRDISGIAETMENWELT